MNLLIATDHSFFRRGDEVYDDYCFDKAFFDDYLAVFDSVDVITRMEHIASLPQDAIRSNGEGIRFVDVKNIRRAKWHLFAKILSYPALKRAVSRADAVVVRIPSQLGWLAAREAVRQGKPYMVEVIGDPKEAFLSSGSGFLFWLVAWVEEKRLRWLAHHATAGSFVSRHLSDIYPLPNNSPFDIISSIRLDDAELTQPREHFARSGTFTIVHVGRLEPRKRCQDLITSCRKVLDQGVPINLYLIGDGIERSKLETLRKTLALDENVVFYGHIADGQKINDLLDGGDLFVMPSASEGLPRAIIEAMARGLPVIGSDTPGIDELLPDTDRFPMGDTEALTDLVLRLSKDSDRLAEMSQYSLQTARHYASSELSPKRQALYRNLVDAY